MNKTEVSMADIVIVGQYSMANYNEFHEIIKSKLFIICNLNFIVLFVFIPF